MLMLAIDTTGQFAFAAVDRDGEITEKINNAEFSHLQEITPMIKSLMDELGIKGSDFDAVAVSRGPGSFTGVRIGVVTAKALAQVWDKPVITVPTLESFAFGDYDWLDEKENVLICPLFDARRSQVYSGVYEPKNRQALVEDSACPIDELLENLKAVFPGHSRVIFFGDGVRVYEEKLASCGLAYMLAPEKDRLQKASYTARLAEVMLAAGEVCDCFTAEPEYLRAAEAERKLKEKNENVRNNG